MDSSDKRKNWKPTAYTRICSEHLLDGVGPNFVHSNKIPTENLAQRPKTVATKSRRVLLQIKPETCDVGFGTCKPEITIEDVHYSEEKIQFYTGLPNYHTFEALFTTLTNLDNNTLSSGTGRTRKHRPVD
ncbi:uncharacterized protein LOC128215417 [Mya arenaria]|uniref:uncharacterized protein LOC128215417 n=1 Tax=Mya arenaria TaxID=6604 RepID=UPI0022E97B18|nr:uncharacterized protein LOC128215417 [Mya arenaria]